MKFFSPGPRRVLDVGCGAGHFGSSLREKLGPETEIWGIEYQPEIAEQARGRLDRVYSGDVMRIVDELPTGYFDLIIFNDVLEHLADPYSLLQNVKRSLSAQGRVFSSIPNILFFNTLRTLLIKRDFRYEESGVLDRTHLRFFTRKSIIRMFEEQGYTVEHIEGISPKRDWGYKIINALLLNALSQSRWMQYACLARPNTP